MHTYGSGQILINRCSLIVLIWSSITENSANIKYSRRNRSQFEMGLLERKIFLSIFFISLYF